MFFYQDSSTSRLYSREKAMLSNVFPRDYRGFQPLPFLLTVTVMMGTQLLPTIVPVHLEAATVSRCLQFSAEGTWLHFPEVCSAENWAFFPHSEIMFVGFPFVFKGGMSERSLQPPPGVKG